MKVPNVLKETLGWAAVLALLCVLAWLVAGCASGTEYQIKLNPATGEGTATLSKTGLVEPLSGTGLTEADVLPPAESGGLFGLLTAGLAIAGGFGFAGPKSWANWATILKPSASWKATGQSAAALVGLAHTPDEAKRPNPDRSDP